MWAMSLIIGILILTVIGKNIQLHKHCQEQVINSHTFRVALLWTTVKQTHLRDYYYCSKFNPHWGHHNCDIVLYSAKFNKYQLCYIHRCMAVD